MAVHACSVTISQMASYWHQSVSVHVKLSSPFTGYHHAIDDKGMMSKESFSLS